MTVFNKNNKTSKNLRTHLIHSAISVGVALCMLGLIIFILTSARLLFNNMQENVNFIVEFKSETGQLDIEDFRNVLESKIYYKPDSYTLIPKEEALDIMKDDLGKDLEKVGIDNPFYDIVTFNIKSEHITQKNLEIIQKDLSKIESIQNINFQEFMLENIANNLNKALLFSAVVGVLFFSLALYLLYSTMKLWLFIKRFSVRIMQLVGATPQFICRPFIKQSITVGALGATLAVLILLIFYFILLNFVPDLKRQDFVLSFVGILALLYLLGVLITGVSASLIINRYLRSKTEELY